MGRSLQRGGVRRRVPQDDDARDDAEVRTLTEAEVRALISESEARVLQGFPKGDLHAHRIKHEDQDKNDDQVSKLKWSIMEKLLISFLTFLGSLILLGLWIYLAGKGVFNVVGAP